ncbi:putative transposase [Phytophthora citrophthora]|uniref:Transposase n=1 Tax=Phytophthora citrophthora TaxID=4793 RepID=A0AAD9GUV9_9STRA|nr:putative transposase [Phytophthora citrophthora]
MVKSSRKRSAPKRRPSKRKKRRETSELLHPSIWFKQEIATALWMPQKADLVSVLKPRRLQKERRVRSSHRKKRKRTKRRERRHARRTPAFVRERVPESQRLLEPLLTSWFDVDNLAQSELPSRWRLPCMAVGHRYLEMDETLKALDVEDEESVNSVIKIRLYPTNGQKEKLDQMFAAQRAIYNKMVALSNDDRKTRLASHDKAVKMTLKEFGLKYRPIATLETIDKYFRNKRGLKRHKEVNDQVRNSAYRDFMKATKSSIAGFFAALKRGDKTEFPVLKFKSKFAASNSIEIRAREINVVEQDAQTALRFHARFFGFAKNDGIVVHEELPPLMMSVRLQRLREGDYYICVPRLRIFQETKQERVCAIDPGVVNFATVYDPDGRTFSVKDAHNVLMKKFEAVDALKSQLALKDNVCKARHKKKVRTKKKRGRKGPKGEEHRLRYRLRRRMRFTSRKATRCVNDLHQKLSCWLSENYKVVLLPYFQTQEMVAKHLEEVASDATSATASETDKAATKKRKIRSPTARALMAQAHFKFKQLLKYTMKRTGGRVIDCEEEYTSKTCSSCGVIKQNLGGSRVFRCGSCHAVLDRDVSAAKNILHKNVSLLA